MTIADQDGPSGQPPSGSVRAVALLAFGGALLLAGLQVRHDLTTPVLIAAGIGLFCAAVVVWVRRWLVTRTLTLRRAMAIEFLNNDPALCFLTDELGIIRFAGRSAVQRMNPASGLTLANALCDILPNPRTTLRRLQIRAEGTGGGFEELLTRRGRVRLSVTSLGAGGLAWRIEDIQDIAARAGDPSPFPRVTVGRAGTVLSMNEAARAVAGGRARTLTELFPDLPLRSGQVCSARLDGERRRCFVVESRSATGKQEIHFIPTEQTELRTDQPSFEGLPVAVLRLGPGGEIDQSNRLARTLLGLSSTGGVTLQSRLEGLGRSITDWLEDALQGRGLNKSEFLRLRSSDADVFIQVSLERVKEEGKTFLIAVLHDATELKTLEAQFVQSQKMQAIGELAGGIAHDFNNLLTAISGHCDLLMLRHDHGDSDFADLAQISQNANRAAALVGQLLAFSRKQTLRPEVLDVRETLADLTHLLNRLVGEKVSLSLNHDPVLKTIRADKRQLEQVLMNLVVNARDAMPGGGEIRIETGNHHLAVALERDRATVPPGDYVVIRVSDQGCGIPADKLQKIFEPFFTTKRQGEGTGLGLSTAYGIVKQSGGYIFVDSEVDKGAEFSLMFPVHLATREELTAPPQTPPPKQRLNREEGVVLLVEDEAPVRAFASRALKLRGYSVVEAGSGEEAMELLQNEGLEIDLFVTDVIMPGMDGPSWVRKARQDRPNVRVVFMSGYAEDALGDNADPVGNSVFLPKPFSLNELLETVQKQMA
ncbi:ATP-binding protein [Thalassovita sp.]|uniref:hybrid sensor histidine kinase/response regulator n=1 Tax=Thalassovita sp. TaxID=1979401 RepID=UPI0029DE58F5|nr:ATP-binding protein [Thalassovita sp.]